jgi:hypothetical protein
MDNLGSPLGVGSRFGNNLAMYAVGVIHSVFDNSGFYTRSDRVIGFAANTSPYTNVDTAIGRDSAGVMQVNNGTLNTYRDLKLRSLISSNETVTSSTPILNLTQTWNSGATTFKAITLDVTDTTSASASKFLDFSLGGTSKFSVDKNGNVSLNNLTVNGTHNITMTATPGGTSGQIQYNNGGSLGGMSGSTISGSNMTLTGTFGATSATLTGGTITTSTPAVTATQTWNNVATTFTGLSLDVTDTASASGSKLLDLMVGSSTKFSVDKAGGLTASSGVFSGNIDLSSTSEIRFGNTASYPKLRRVTNRLEVYRYDGTGYQDLWANNLVAMTSMYSFGEIASATNLTATNDVSVGRDILGAAATELRFGSDAKILRNTTGQIDVRADSGLRIRNFANGAYASLSSYDLTTIGGTIRIMEGTGTYGPKLKYGGQQAINVEISDGSSYGHIGSGWGGSYGALVGTWSSYHIYAYQHGYHQASRHCFKWRYRKHCNLRRLAARLSSRTYGG